MRIAYITPEFVTEKPLGGLGVYIYNISTIMVSLGNEVTVIVCSNQSGVFFFEGIRVIRVKVELPISEKDIQTSYSRIKSHYLNAELLRANDYYGSFDVVQYSNWNALGFERTSIPTIIRVSSDTPLWRAAGKKNFDIETSYPPIKGIDFLEDLALLKADSIIGPSKLIADVISKRIDRDIEIIESPFIRNFQNDVTCPEILQGKKYLVSFGTVNFIKGMELLSRAVPLILKKYPDLYYVVVGKDTKWNDESGEHSVIDYLTNRICENSDRFIYLGEKEHTQLYPILKNSIACVLVSRIDNFPNSCIEAMSSGCLVIGTRGASFEQLITDGFNGFLTDRENCEELVEKIQTVMKLSESERNRILCEAVNTTKRLIPEKIGKKMQEYYEKVASLKPRELGFLQDQLFSEIAAKYNHCISESNQEMAKKYLINDKQSECF